jgi:superfamily I DNA/RNA helicase/mRNA-degrading endonuclease RelE of RelBE toxin-antitoxin system
MALTVALSTTFLESLGALPRNVQGKVTDFVQMFKNNPRSPGINYEKIKISVDKKLFSVRIDDNYRGVVVREEESGAYLLLWVDSHDKAYQWAARRRCEVNPKTGVLQIFEAVSEEIAGEPTAAPEGRAEVPGPFADLSDERLLDLHVPKELLPLVRALPDEAAFFARKSSFPIDANENLEFIAAGLTFQDVMRYLAPPRGEGEGDAPPPPGGLGLAESLKKPGSLQAFYVVEGQEELRRILAAPLERWRVFLHPTQRWLANRDFNGPARVLGGAGTGKTVVAMHRAKYLAGQLTGGGRVLFTTFTANLAEDIKDNLRKICSKEELRRIEVVNLDAWVFRFLKSEGFDYKFLKDDELRGLWREAIDGSGEPSFDGAEAFLADEWAKVVVEGEAFTREAYLRARRVGRGARLDRSRRQRIWRVFEEYLELMRKRKVRDWDTAYHECHGICLKSGPVARYQAIVVDEGQDFSAGHLRLVRALAGPRRVNDLFIVGDSHQRIYKRKVVLGRCGIDIRGRGHHLRLNYRTTEETRNYAFAVLRDLSFDDLDGGADDCACRSLTHGEAPRVVNFPNAAQEMEFVVGEILALREAGAVLRNICLAAREDKLLNGYDSKLGEAGLPTRKITRSQGDRRAVEAVRLATMHRIKGLEFQYVFIVAANKGVIPHPVAFAPDSDDLSRAETEAAERCLLYVALTRAQKKAYVTSYGPASELIP